ncbi:Rv3654c family TadE-like protein [Solicola sp. PLA-1-18]|uniref:Rv3654c family TadE-like protein n=1 Tax=Solicola sp. PLA-1-18 TaxID=3380532 RepID=UPI003B7FA826
MRRGERGSGTVHAATVCVALAAVALVAVQAAGLLAVKHRVTAAADLAALAASQAAETGGEGCESAAEVARLNGARLVRCQMVASVATVAVDGRSPRVLGRRWSVERTARAAPSDHAVDG